MRHLIANYYGMISHLDEQIGRILQTLAKTGREQNTIVIFAGDNGHAFPHGKGSLYDPGFHVPLLMRWAGELGEGAAPVVQGVASVCSPIDLAAGGWAIGRGFNRLVYTRMFLRSMKPKALAKLAEQLARWELTPTGTECYKKAEVTLGGVAWRPSVGVRSVEVSVDDGAWQEAELGTVSSENTWVTWRLATDLSPGKHQARVRAIDADGRPRPLPVR